MSFECSSLSEGMLITGNKCMLFSTTLTNNVMGVLKSLYVGEEGVCGAHLKRNRVIYVCIKLHITFYDCINTIELIELSYNI